jgi:hypothetical protein
MKKARQSNRSSGDTVENLVLLKRCRSRRRGETGLTGRAATNAAEPFFAGRFPARLHLAIAYDPSVYDPSQCQTCLASSVTSTIAEKPARDPLPA